MSNEVKRVSKNSDAWRAVLNMMNEMREMWDGFSCDGEIISDRRGAYVKVGIPLEEMPDAWTKAILFRNGDEYICMVDWYIGEDSAFRGTEDNWYTVDDCYNLIPA
jgi:hypothetical protein